MSQHRRMIDLIKSFSGQANVLTIPRVYIDLTGDLEAALVLSQCVYWSDKSSNRHGFYKTAAEWYSELHLTRKKLDRCLKQISRWVKVSVHKANGAPTRHFKVNVQALAESISELLETDISEMSKRDKSEMPILDKSLTETTHKITTTPADAEGGAETTEQRPTTARGRLELVFEKLSGIPHPAQDTSRKKTAAIRWWNPIQELLILTAQDEQATEELMRRAIDNMRGKKLTIAAPQSILAVCISLWSEDSQRITTAADVNFWNSHIKNSRGEVVEIK